MSNRLYDLVLSIVSDDYENLLHIEELVQKHLATVRESVTHQDVENALRSLVANGAVAAFMLDPNQPKAEEMTLGSRPIEELWFYATQYGRSVAAGLADVLKN